MSRTPYFDEYEATRRNRTVTSGTIRFGDAVLRSNLAANTAWTPITSATTVNFPTYRVIKQYNNQGIISDFTIEMRHHTDEEWTPIPEVMRYA